MSPRIAVVRFPGTNCEFDAADALVALGADAEVVWHREDDLSGFDAVVLPGGFAHGDYLRCGAIARFSPVMAPVGRFAALGAPVLGICNGFQVLAEAGLLPGALMRNAGLRFLCETVEVEVDTDRSVLTDGCPPGTVLRLPINHYEGNYTADEATLARLSSSDQLVLRYVDNPNGSVAAIAAVSNEAGNVVGLMPHPERAIDELFGSADGRPLLASFVHAAQSYAERMAPVGAERMAPVGAERTAPVGVERAR